MSRGREIETLLLTMFAAVPLYFTQAVNLAPLLIFHAVMSGIVIRVAAGRGPDLIPEALMRVLAFAYVLFYLVDWAVISHSAIAASTHLVLFIATYQPIESVRKNNYAQRLLTTALIFVASLATATHITIVPFVVVFAFLMFREMMFVSHLETVQAIGHEYALPPMSKAAGFYLGGTVLIGALLFPVMPRVRNPLVRGITGSLTNASTGLSESINFNEARTSSPDPAVVARVWMGPDAIPFFTPLRLRAAVYDAYQDNKWLQTRMRRGRELRHQRGVYQIARPLGFHRDAVVQQRLNSRTGRLFLPVGTYAVAGVQPVWEGPTRDAFTTYQPSRDIVNFSVAMARETKPSEERPVATLNYPVSPAIAALAHQIVGEETLPERRAALVEAYLLHNYTYVQRPEQIGSRPMTTDEFLLRVHRGHCEYFAAGMVALMSALDVPARIVGGFYGGRMNPLTGYFVVRNEDAHAWVEVWNRDRWTTYDPTPPSLRPGDGQSSLLGRYATALSDSVNYFWDRYILTYGLSDQIALIADMIGRARTSLHALKAAAISVRQSSSSAGVLSLLIGILVVAFGGILLAGRRRPLFDILELRLRALGIAVGPATTVEEAVALVRDKHPELAGEVEEIVRLYEAEQFSSQPDRQRVAQIRKRLAEFRA